jgi:hypothetical protein
MGESHKRKGCGEIELHIGVFLGYKSKELLILWRLMNLLDISFVVCALCLEKARPVLIHFILLT